MQLRSARIRSAKISVCPGYLWPAAWSASLFNGAVVIASISPANPAAMLAMT